jgi:hypothetical protein
MYLYNIRKIFNRAVTNDTTKKNDTDRRKKGGGDVT